MSEINTIEPPVHLKKYVQSFWYGNVVSSSQALFKYKILADGKPGLIFQHSHGNSTIFEEDGSGLPVAFIYGQSTTPCINHIGNSFVFGIHFKPTSLKSLFSIDANEATNSLINLNDVSDYSITEELLNTPDPFMIANVLSSFLSRKLKQNEKQDMLIDKSVDDIWRNIDHVTAENLPLKFNLSRRQFQRRFKQYVGVCPEFYIRIIKFQTVIKLLKAKNYHKLSDIAYKLSYADQSHFIREFKFFSGSSPTDFIRQQVSPVNSGHNLFFDTVRLIQYKH